MFLQKFAKQFGWGLLVIALLLALSLIVIIILFHSGTFELQDTQQEALYLRYANATFGISTLLLLTLLIGSFIRLVIHFVFISGKHWFSRVFAVGFITLIYFKGIYALFVVPANSIIDVSRYFFENGFAQQQQYYNQSTTFFNPDDQYSTGYNHGYEDGYKDGSAKTEQHSAQISNAVTDVVKKTNQSFFSTLLSLSREWSQRFMTGVERFFRMVFNADNIRSMLIGLLLMAAFGFLSDKYLVADSGEALKQMIYKERLNIIFAGIFILGSFLSISAIIAIPELQKGTSTDGISEDDFKREIEEIYKVNNSLGQDVDFKANTSPFNEMQQRLSRVEANLSFVRSYSDNKDDFIIPRQDVLNYLKNLQHDIKEVTKAYGRETGEMNDVKESFDAEIEQKKNTYVQQYAYNMYLRAVGNERGELFVRLLSLYEYFISAYKQSFQRNVQIFRTLDKKNQAQLASMNLFIDNLENSMADSLILSSEYRAAPFSGFESVDINWKFEDYFGGVTLDDESGSGSLFHWLAQWLVDARSDEMVLIAGMLGFGLLGAGIASLIRNREVTDQGMFKKNITGVIIGGVSASLVIFLSAKGGLAILSSQDIQLNPYTLLFLCLVGSVFSEVIWEKAYNYIKSDSNTSETTPAINKSSTGNSDSTDMNKNPPTEDV
ncbi:hypothetical protein LVD17_09400 [Fulvivirga ulvae]|uniref:hypothetical protein n=1 Tax=Fulvivirga ulvae TaxID=2904245 RepID=UPI001F26BCC8|nr:hypothetical protein [Fulvivirga ulvae]UII34027.1 hypothetical protein LVD17_09400 [Fulvivirga ulvae]